MLDFLTITIKKFRYYVTSSLLTLQPKLQLTYFFPQIWITIAIHIFWNKIFITFITHFKDKRQCWKQYNKQFKKPFSRQTVSYLLLSQRWRRCIANLRWNNWWVWKLHIRFATMYLYIFYSVHTRYRYESFINC